MFAQPANRVLSVGSKFSALSGRGSALRISCQKTRAVPEGTDTTSSVAEDTTKSDVTTATEATTEGAESVADNTTKSDGATEKTEDAPTQETAAQPEEKVYSVTLSKPLKMQLQEGPNGGAYVYTVPDPELMMIKEKDLPEYAKMSRGDKVLAHSASFGNDVEEAKDLNSVVFALDSRKGDIYLVLEKCEEKNDKLIDEMFPKMKKLQKIQDKRVLDKETRATQRTNVQQRKALKALRQEQFNQACDAFAKGNYKGAREIFNEILASEPRTASLAEGVTNFTSAPYALSWYGLACVESKEGNIESGLNSLEQALKAERDNPNVSIQMEFVKKDPDIADLREDPQYEDIIEKYEFRLFKFNLRKEYLKFKKWMDQGN